MGPWKSVHSGVNASTQRTERSSIPVFERLEPRLLLSGDLPLGATLDPLPSGQEEPAILVNVQAEATLLVTNTNDAGVGSLRQAILDAHANSDLNAINFAIGSGAQTITLLSPLPTISNALTIDGTSQPGYIGVPLITLDAVAVGAGTVLTIAASDCTVEGLTIANAQGTAIQLLNANRCTLSNLDLSWSGQSRGGIGIFLHSSSGNTIENVTVRNRRCGIDLAQDADNNVIRNCTVAASDSGVVIGVDLLWGGSTPISSDGNRVESCVLAGCTGRGIHLDSVTGTVIEGSDISGCAEAIFGGWSYVVSGTKIFNNDLRNSGGWAVTLFGDSLFEMKGNDFRGSANGLQLWGVDHVTLAADVLLAETPSPGTALVALAEIRGTAVYLMSATNSTIRDLDLSWTGPEQSGIGVFLVGYRGPASGNTIENVTVRNRRCGIDLAQDADNNVIRNCTVAASDSGVVIGVDLLWGGSTPISSDGNRVESCVLAGCTGRGIHLDSVTGTVIEGSDISGCAEAIFGGWSYAVTGTIIEGNSVHSNTGAGIVITAGTGNRIQGNSIYDNGGLGIDLGGNGITPNDAGDTDTGPNNYQNFPVLASVLGGSTTRIQGSLNSTPDTTFILDFYASSGADPSGYGEGERYLGAASVTTDAVGNGSFDVKLKAQTGLGEFVTATATDPQGNTSEFSMGMTINELSTANVSGEVFVDVNQNGEYDADEPGIDGVTIELLDENGTPVLDVEGQRVIAMTSDGGFYLFEGVDPGIYQLHEVQPTGVEDGAEILGSLGGTIPANDTMRLLLEGDEASDYAFAELGLAVTSGDTATIGFWQSKNGQKLIGLGGAGLADWLTANFGNVFGNVLVGGDGETVAGFFKKQLFLQKAEKSAEPAKVDAQYMAVALATYFTSSYLAGNVAGEFGFHVTDTGIGTRIVNVGICGAAFGEANGTDLTIMQLLLATNDRTDVPDSVIGFAWIYDENGDGLIDAAEAELRRLANEVYSAINEAGDR